MKHLMARTLTSLIFVVVGLAATAPAQSTRIVKANIPFEFSFGNRSFPAGEYSLVQSQQHLLALRDPRGHSIAQVLTGPIYSLTPAAKTTLKFYSSNGQHILAEVWQEQDASGEQLYEPKNQVERAQQRSAYVGTSEGGQP